MSQQNFLGNLFLVIRDHSLPFKGNYVAASISLTHYFGNHHWHQPGWSCPRSLHFIHMCSRWLPATDWESVRAGSGGRAARVSLPRLQAGSGERHPLTCNCTAAAGGPTVKKHLSLLMAAEEGTGSVSRRGALLLLWNCHRFKAKPHSSTHGPFTTKIPFCVSMLSSEDLLLKLSIKSNPNYV